MSDVAEAIERGEDPALALDDYQVTESGEREILRQTTDRANDHAVDVWEELAEMSCYQEAAQSMAVVGQDLVQGQDGVGGCDPPHHVVGIGVGYLLLHRQEHRAGVVGQQLPGAWRRRTSLGIRASRARGKAP